MHKPPPLPDPGLEAIQEDHLRLAVLLDQIDDDLEAGLPVGGRIASLIAEFEQHSQREEAELARIASADHAEHRKGHDRMRALLRTLAETHDAGGDIRPNLGQVLRLFTDQLLPADAVFLSR